MAEEKIGGGGRVQVIAARDKLSFPAQPNREERDALRMEKVGADAAEEGGRMQKREKEQAGRGKQNQRGWACSLHPLPPKEPWEL